MPTETHNRMAWSGGSGHYEVWYLTLSHRASRAGFWIRYTLEAPQPGHGAPYAQLWFARFDPANPTATFGINRRFPIDRLAAIAEPFSVTIDAATLHHDGMRGALTGDGHDVRWDLRWRPAASVQMELPRVIYRLPVDTKVFWPNLDVAIDGEIVVDGERYPLTGAPGGQTHLHGRKHAHEWAWAHANCFDDHAAAVFEGLAVRLKRGPVVLPNLTVCALHLDGEKILLNRLSSLLHSRSEYGTGYFRLRGGTPLTRVEATFSCRNDDLVLTEYADPDGEPSFCHNSCCADGVIMVRKRSPFFARWRRHRTLIATRTAHFEWGARAPDAVNVSKRHVTVPAG